MFPEWVLYAEGRESLLPSAPEMERWGEGSAMRELLWVADFLWGYVPRVLSGRYDVGFRSATGGQVQQLGLLCQLRGAEGFSKTQTKDLSRSPYDAQIQLKLQYIRYLYQSCITLKSSLH